jgi:organic hydroperoxide reductase OsmC/OhrA
VSGTGHLTARDDGRFGFVAIDLTAVVRTDEHTIDAMERAAKHAGRACLVSTALDVPVHVDVSVRPISRALEVVA